MTSKAAQISPDAYLQGFTLWEAIFRLGDPEAVKNFNADRSPPSYTPPEQGASILNILNNTLQELQNIQAQQDRRKKIEGHLMDGLLNLIKKGDLTAFGFKAPRNIEDQAIKIPADLFFCGEINWNKSELKSQNLAFSGIRIFKNTGAIIDLTSNNTENPKKRIENKFENKSVKKNFSDLDTGLHVDEKKAAAFLGISPRTLQGYRLKGGGPKYRKIGNKAIRYKIQDLMAWSDGNKKDNTSQN